MLWSELTIDSPVESAAKYPDNDGLAREGRVGAGRPHVQVETVLGHVRVGVPHVSAEEDLSIVFEMIVTPLKWIISFNNGYLRNLLGLFIIEGK